MLVNAQGKDVTAEWDAGLANTHPKMRQQYRHETLPDLKEVLQPTGHHGKMFRLGERARHNLR